MLGWYNSSIVVTGGVVEWSEKQQKYQLWSALPKELLPDGMTTTNQFAAAINVSPETLYVWENTLGWWEEVYQNVKSIIGRALPRVVTAIVNKAQTGNVPAAKLCLSMLNLHNDKLTVENDLLADQLIIVLNTTVSPNLTGLPAPITIDMPSKVVDQEASSMLQIETQEG